MGAAVADAPEQRVRMQPLKAVVVSSSPAMLGVIVTVVALVLAQAFLEKFGGDSLAETERNYEGYLEQVRSF